MNWTTPKFWPTAAASIIAGSCLLNASDEARMRNIENRISSLECSQNSCYLLNPSARCYADDCCWGFYATVDPLIWQAHVNGTGFAILADQPSLAISDVRAKVEELHFHWDWGFRLGIGLNTPHDGWDVLLRWTWWHSRASKHVRIDANDGLFLFPRIGLPVVESNIVIDQGETKSRWKLRYNVLDLENGRDFYVSKCLTLRPHAGLRTAWIDQKFKTEFVENVPGFIQATFHDQKDRFWGIGIRGGIDMQWNVGCGFSLFSNFAGSLLYGYHRVKNEPSGLLTLIDEETEVDFLGLNLKDFYHVGTAIFDAQLGVRWEWSSCDCCYHLVFDLGWENHWHPGQNQFIFFADDVQQGNYFANQGDLGIQGYYLRVRFDF